MNLSTLLLLSMVSTGFVDVTIADHEKTYEHHYKKCNVDFLSPFSGSRYFYATCGTYSAPPLYDIGFSTRNSATYNEIGVNGVEWANCKLTDYYDLGYLKQFRFDCNKYEPPFMDAEIWYTPDNGREICLVCKPTGD